MTTLTMDEPRTMDNPRAMEDTRENVEYRPKHERHDVESTRPGRVFSPAVDIYETDDALTLVADMPGVRAEHLDIDLRENVLTIDGRVDVRTNENERPLMQEYAIGSYRSEFRLTELIDRDRIAASLKDGVLRLTLPKAERARPRKIEIRGA